MERQAQAIDRGLICPVCPGESIDQSRVELARQMRATVREKLAAGWTPEQVKEFFVERYGPGVLAAPPQRGFNVIAWFVPPLAVLLGVTALLMAIRGMRRQRGGDGETLRDRPSEEPLEAYLAEADAVLTSPRTPNQRVAGSE